MRSSTKSILFVCEDATMLEVRQLLLERVGYKVWPTNSLRDAQLIAQDTCPDLLLFEDGYPTGNSEQLANSVKSVCPRIIAVALTPYWAVKNASHSAIDKFLARDESPDLLLAQIDELFQQGDERNENHKRAHCV
jgi:DNA-binding NtrC family response regulator